MPRHEEDGQDYRPGGYHPVSIGDSFSNNRYIVVRKLGWGEFSTVWLARDEKMQRHVALKIVGSAPRYAELAVDEIKLLQRLVTSSDPSTRVSHPGKSHVISFFDHFTHDGPNGTHVCMVFEVLGESLLALIERYKNKGVPILLVKQIAKQILLGLDYMHRNCGIIHTDLKPENVLIYIPDAESVILAEFALHTSSSSVPLSTSPPSPHIQPTMQKLTGVPASTGRGANVTPGPRHRQISTSQPLPSISSSGNSVGLASSSSGAGRGGRSNLKLPGNKWGLEMLKISPDDAKAKGKEGGVGDGDLDLGMSALSVSSSEPPCVNTIPIPGLCHKSLALDSGRSGEAVQHGEGSVDAEDDHETITVRIADLGNATWTDHHFTNDIQTRQYRCPEVIIGSTTWGTSADIWSVACILFELLTGGDYLFEPATANHGNLLYIKQLRPWPLRAEADSIAGFLLPMLEVDPAARMSAEDLVRHEWLADVHDADVVGGERVDDAMKPAYGPGEVPLVTSTVGNTAVTEARGTRSGSSRLPG
ncbi:kinase-like domain-containing protein [Mycena olivaceomarginata]|nr:kinase-like domain-containing protein [Mycena olivaceomarginata]